MNSQYRIFDTCSRLKILILLLATFVFLTGAVNASEGNRNPSIGLDLTGIVNALKEDPLNRDLMEIIKNYPSGQNVLRANPLNRSHPLLLKNHLFKTPAIFAKAAQTTKVIVLFQNYDQGSQGWINESRMIEVYDNAGRVIQMVNENYIDGEWKGYYRTLLEYQGSSHDVYISTTEFWDEESGKWDNGGRRTRYIAYQNGLPIEVIDEIWEDDAWQPFMKSVMTWTAGRMPLETLDYHWTGDAWEISGRERWIWENGLLTEVVNEWWDGEDWIVDMRWKYTYDNNGNEIEYIFQMADWFTGELKNFTRELTTYDAQGNATESIDQFWDDGNAVWVNTLKTVYEEYNNRGNLIRSVSYTYVGDTLIEQARYHYHYDGNGDLRMMVIEEWTGSSWLPTGRILYGDFDPTSVAAGEGLPDHITLMQNYPNPFNPSTTIRYSIHERIYVVISVFNTVGQEITKLVDGEFEPGYYEVKFDASHLPSGVYIYRLQAGEFVQSKKFMLLK